MAAEYSKWIRYNLGHYVNLDLDEQIYLAIELKNELDTGDYLLNCVATTTSTGLTIVGATALIDVAEGFVNPHQQLVIVKPTARGTHRVKLKSDTADGRVIVKHFDILTER